MDFTWRARDLTLLRRLFPRMAELLDEEMVGVLRAAVARELLAGKLQPQVSHNLPPREVATVLATYYQLLVSGCAAVASLAKRGGTDLSALEPSLARSLKKIDGSLVGVATHLLGEGTDLDRTEEQRHAAALALVTALAWIGTRASLSALRDACAYPDPRVARLAVRAIEEITARTG